MAMPNSSSHHAAARGLACPPPSTLLLHTPFLYINAGHHSSRSCCYRLVYHSTPQPIPLCRAGASQQSPPQTKGSSAPGWMSQIGKAVLIAFTTLEMTTSLPMRDSVFDWTLGSAQAVLYSPDTKVPRNAEVALRRAIPAVNSATKKIQDSLEDIFYLLRIPQRKPFGTMEGDVKKALKLAIDERDAILATVPLTQKVMGIQLFDSLTSGKGGLQALLNAIADKDSDRVSVRLASSLETVAQLELLQAPGLPYLLPGDYQGYPRLTGRATVEFTVEKGDGSSFTVAAGGGPKKNGKIEVVLDGYSAPLTSGNFADLVLKGAYNGITLKATDQAVLSDNVPDGTGVSLPIEILPAGEFQPLYRTTLNVQDGELPVLPLSVYGAVAMSHSPTSEDFSASSQFFFYLYDKRSAGLGGLSFDEGTLQMGRSSSHS